MCPLHFQEGRLAWTSPHVLQADPPLTGVLKGEIHESALGSVPEGAPGNRGALGVLPRVLGEIGGGPGSAPKSALSVDAPQKEHSREHSLERPQFPAPPRAPRFPGALSGALPRALSWISHFSTPVTGGWACKTCCERKVLVCA